MKPGTGPRSAAAVTLGCALGLAACGGSREPPEPEHGSAAGPVQITIDAEETHQTLEGFGASVAWYQGTLTHHPNSAELYPLLFGDLGLDILRFRNRTGGRVNEAVDLTEERAIYEAAEASLGRAPKLLISSWSPPAGLKANGDDDCDGDDAEARTCTLRRVDGAFDYAGFAEYWLDALSEYAGLGLEPTWISIQNEPDFAPRGWEGCRFDPEEGDYPSYGLALELVAERIATLPNPPALLGPETLGIHYDRVEHYLSALDAGLLAGVSHHIYEQGGDGVWDWRSPGPDSYVDEMRATRAAAAGKPTFQTEFNTDEDGGTQGGFETAWLIHNSMAEQGASAFLYWELIWANSTPARALVFLNDSTYTIRDQYYALRHFSLHTDPGYVRIGGSSSHTSVRVSAYREPDGQRLVVVALNVSPSPRTVTLDLGSFAGAVQSAVRSTFEAGERWVEQSLGEGNSLELPARSIATLVFE